MSIPSWLLRAHKLSRLPRLTQSSLGVEITLLLVIKLSLLMVLARVFFSEPQAKHMRMPTAAVEQHLLPPEAPALRLCAAAVTTDCAPVSASPIHSPTHIEVTHASH